MCRVTGDANIEHVKLHEIDKNLCFTKQILRNKALIFQHVANLI